MPGTKLVEIMAARPPAHVDEEDAATESVDETFRHRIEVPPVPDGQRDTQT